MIVSGETINHHIEENEVNRYLYEYDNISTWLAETLDGNMRTSFEFSFYGNELYGHDGTRLGKVFYDSLSEAERIARERPNLAFQLRRAHIEEQEYQDMLKMGRGELPNTMIVVSDFPPELMDAKEDVGGYNVSRKQTMLRVIYLRPDGRLVMTSQSLDLSDPYALDAIYDYFGIKPQPGERLGQRIYTKLQAEDQPYIIDKLMGVYDRTLSERYGGNWQAGRKGQNTSNTYDFVLRQHDLLDMFVMARLNNPSAAEEMLYNLAAAIERRKTSEETPHHSALLYSNLSQGYAMTDALQYELMIAGSNARANGRSYSGCGASLSGGGEMGTLEQLHQLGYGNKLKDKDEYKFDKKTFCRICQDPPKPNDKPKMCGPCNICRACDPNASKI